jgi:peptidoglycan/LPS O-acetylase OafA/YrhL
MTAQGTARDRWIAGLTPLRGVAALLVVLFHAPIFGVGFSAYSVTYFFYQGWLWVDFFFLLSGFIMAHVYGDAFSAQVTARRYRDFLVSRFARLWPLHFATLLMMVVLNLAKFAIAPPFTEMLPAPFVGRDAPGYLPVHLLFVQSFAFPGDTWNVPSWSIAAEWWAYLVFPFLFLLLRRLAAAVRLAIFAACYAAIVAVWFGGGGTLNNGYGWAGMIRCLAEFTIGIGVYEVWASGRFARLLSRDAAFAGLAVATALALHFFIPDFLVIPLLAGLVLAGASNRGRLGLALGTRPMVWLGEVSYSIYLLQWPVLVAVALGVAAIHGTPVTKTPSKIEALLLLPIALGFILGLAGLTYRGIELPARRQLRRVLAPGSASVSTTGPRTPLARMPDRGLSD